jgi:hypothetical protein
MQKVLLAFDTPDGRGPGAFFTAFIESLLGVGTADWLVRENEVRELTARAVQRIFECCEFVDE